MKNWSATLFVVFVFFSVSGSTITDAPQKTTALNKEPGSTITVAPQKTTALNKEPGSTITDAPQKTIALNNEPGAYQYRGGECLLLNRECITDSECCSGNCRKYFSVFKRYCTDFSDHCLLLAGIKEIFVKPQYETVTCVFDERYETTNGSSGLNERFGKSHGMFARYEPSTVVTVRRGYRTYNLVVDDRPATVTNVTARVPDAAADGVLVLSRVPAAELDVAGNATETCEVRVLVLNNHPVLKAALYTAPAVGLFAGIFAFIRYSVFV